MNLIYRTAPLWIYFVFAVGLSMPPPARAQSDKIPAELVEKAQTEGMVPVLVGLIVPWQAEEDLTEEAVQTQRNAIGAVQRQLLAELGGTRFEIVRRYQEIPGIALAVGADALAVLASSTSVTNVLPDRPMSRTHQEYEPHGPKSQPADQKIVKVPPELFEIVKSAGTVLVLVGLKAPWRPETRLTNSLVVAQRKAIAASQDYLLLELTGTEYKVTRLFRKIPGIALEVGAEALKVLAKSAAVTNVLKDRPGKPKP